MDKRAWFRFLSVPIRVEPWQKRSMLKRYMHKRERHFAMLEDNRVVYPFEWGTEFVTDNANGTDPRELFSKYSADVLANSDEFFFSPEISDYRLESRLQAAPTWEESRLKPGLKANEEGRLKPGLKAGDHETLVWTSGIETPTHENNTAYAAYFPHETNTETAILVLPHWNAKAGTYFVTLLF